MKAVSKFILVSLFVIGLTGLTHLFITLPFMEGKDIASLGQILSAVTAAIAVFYAIISYKDHLLEKKNNLLCLYNKRYTEDKSVEKVVRWMLSTAKMDENGGIVGHDPSKEVKDVEKPDVYDKEMFMRFFEELNIQIDNHLLNEDNTLQLFAEYALIFDEYPSFRKDITDYDNEGAWTYFHSFIRKIKRAKSINEALNRTKKEALSQTL